MQYESTKHKIRNAYDLSTDQSNELDKQRLPAIGRFCNLHNEIKRPNVVYVYALEGHYCAYKSLGMFYVRWSG